MHAMAFRGPPFWRGRQKGRAGWITGAILAHPRCMPSSHPCRPLTASSLVARPLTPGDFQRFGTVLQAPPRVNAARPINAGTALRFDLVDDMQLDAAGGRAQLALFSAQARSFPLVLHEMECHQLGSQTFVPLGARRFVIVVAAAGAPPRGGRTGSLCDRWAARRHAGTRDLAPCPAGPGCRRLRGDRACRPCGGLHAVCTPHRRGGLLGDVTGP